MSGGCGSCGCNSGYNMPMTSDGMMMSAPTEGSGCGDAGMQGMPAMQGMPMIPSVPSYGTPMPAPNLQAPPPAPSVDMSRAMPLNPQRQQQILLSNGQGPVQVSVQEFNSLPGVPTAQPAGWTAAQK
jgi:hypothetical protein